MKDWHGYRDDLSPIGDNLEQANNISFRVRGEIRRRPGLGLRKQLTAQSMGALVTNAGSWIVANDGGDLTGYDLDNDTSFAVASGLTATPRGNWANAGGALYFTNGTDPIQAIPSGAAASTNAGIIGPVGAPVAGAPGAGTVEPGVHLIRYRYKDSATGYYSNPSPELEFTAAGSQNIPLTLVLSGEAKADQMVIEMTLAAGDVYYVVATITASTSYTINVSDLILATQTTANTYAAPDGFGFDAPPVAQLMCEHRGRVYLWGTATGELYWSRALYPEAFSLFDWARKVDFGRSDTPTGLASYSSDLYLFGRRSMRRLTFDVDPAAARLETLPTEHGLHNQRCLVECNDTLFGWGPSGIWKIDGIHPVHISRPIDRTISEVADDSATEQYHAVFDPDERAVWFFFVRDGDTFPQDAFCYELLTNNWSLRSFRHQIQSSLVAGDDVRPTRAWLGDADGGYIWRLQPDQFDALPPPLTSGVLTTGVGSTTTNIVVNEALPTSGQDCVGAIIYVPSTGETARVTANGVNDLTVTPALANALNPSVDVYLGSIAVSGLSEYKQAPYQNQVVSPPRLQVDSITPDGSGIRLRFAVYKNFSTTKEAFTTQSAEDTPPAGVTFVNGFADVDTAQIVGPTIPAPCSDASTLQWEFTQDRPENAIRIINIEWQFDEPPTEEAAR